MSIKAILACDAHWGIGKNNTLPWPKNSEDLEWFKQCTVNGTVVMGRKTWDSLPFKPLRKRHNIVISNTMKASRDVEVITSENLVGKLKSIEDQNVWIIGGASLLTSCIDIVDELWLNNVGGDYKCDVFLPKKAITAGFEASTTDIRSFGIITKWKRKSAV